MSENSLAGSLRRPPNVIARAGRELAARRATLLLGGSLACATALLVGRLDQGWFHHDDGSLGHSAQRVLAGELPHRDFGDLYTGALTFLNAAVFAVAGDDLFNLRIPLFVLFLAFVGCFFALARRLVGPVWAFVATLFAIGWSVPVYPAPMPSWYLLFLSTIGMYTVVRFFETDRLRWLFLAGACGGVSIAVKIVGVWYVAAVLLAVVAAPLLDDTRPLGRRRFLYPAVVILAAVLALGLVAGVVGGHAGAGEVLGLVIPVVALCGAVALLGWRAWRGSGEAHGSAAFRHVVVFIGGVSVPVALLVAPYVATGSVGDLVEGVLITPRSRFEFASHPMPGPATLLWALPVVALFFAHSRASGRQRQVIDVVAGTVILFLAVTAASQPGYAVLWNTTRALAPFAIVLGAFAILRRGEAQDGLQPRVVALVILVGGFSTLLQFPFAAPVYFCYVVPLILLVAVASLRRLGRLNGVLPSVVLIALVIFGIRQLDNQWVISLGHQYYDDPQVTVLDHERASIRVWPEAKREYGSVQELVARHRPGNEPIFAGPDAPEIYFLTGAPNPTPVILDFLDQSGTTRGNRLIRLLKNEKIPVVVLNHGPIQSPRLSRSTVERIRLLYGAGERVGRFEVRWSTD